MNDLKSPKILAWHQEKKYNCRLFEVRNKQKSTNLNDPNRRLVNKKTTYNIFNQMPSMLKIL